MGKNVTVLEQCRPDLCDTVVIDNGLVYILMFTPKEISTQVCLVLDGFIRKPDVYGLGCIHT